MKMSKVKLFQGISLLIVSRHKNGAFYWLYGTICIEIITMTIWMVKKAVIFSQKTDLLQP